MTVFQMVFLTWISTVKRDMQFSLALALMPDKPTTSHLKIPPALDSCCEESHYAVPSISLLISHQMEEKWKQYVTDK
jgi:hypothetical protein